jgi:xylulokinase
MASHILSHDLGTTGDKATLFSPEGKLISSSFAAYKTFYPETGWAEQDPVCYWKVFCEATQALIGGKNIVPSDIGVVAFSGQMMAALPVDKHGDPLRNSIIWADLRSTKQVARVGERIGDDRVYTLTGHRLSASYSATKIMWIRENEPEIYKKTFKFIQAKDFVVGKLTGTIQSDYSDASGMNLLDINKLVWSEELLDATGIDRDKLPELLESISMVGKVGREAALQSGLLEGTPVVIGGGDGACATCGAGVVRENEAYMYLGTSTWMALASTKPVIDPEKRTNTFAHFQRGLYFPAGTMQAGGGSFKWFKDVLGDIEKSEAQEGGDDVYELLTSKAREVGCGSEGLLFLPYLMGERSPLWNPNARGCFIGLSMVHTKNHLIRSVLEGVAYNMRIIHEAFQDQGVSCRVMRMIGGGAKSRVWRKIFADILEKPVARLNFIDEATSIGAAIAGGVGVGLFSSIQDAAKFITLEEEIRPDRNNYPIYRRYYSIFKESYKQLVPVFDNLSTDST